MNEKQKLLTSNLNGEINNIELIELLVLERKINKGYYDTLRKIQLLSSYDDGNEKEVYNLSYDALGGNVK